MEKVLFGLVSLLFTLHCHCLPVGSVDSDTSDVELPALCSLPRDVGESCRDAAGVVQEHLWVHVFQYSPQAGECRRMLYLGCKGNNNRFPTKQACQAFCMKGHMVENGAGAGSNLASNNAAKPTSAQGTGTGTVGNAAQAGNIATGLLSGIGEAFSPVGLSAARNIIGGVPAVSDSEEGALATGLLAAIEKLTKPRGLAIADKLLASAFPAPKPGA